ncbi:DNA-binding protein [uncultured Parasutterella sp.]|uniref:DNA-binding protein n=1 Tax=uncultured Parasutterella sp. TaxID=1263098 RepID=UPI0025B6EBDE|nr:DNA-binding protein [uncultured Parasutterella sp.]
MDSKQNKNFDLSIIERQNVLNNKIAVKEIQKSLNWTGVSYLDDVFFTKSQVARIFAVSEQTIERLTSANNQELKDNGYILLKGKKLNEFKKLNIGTLNNEGTKTTILGIYSFRAVLNIGMLLTESDIAKDLRKQILGIAIDVVSRRIGGQAKYINQRDESFLPSLLYESNYRQAFTAALKNFVVRNNWKYAKFTDLIYQTIFKENAKEYRRILRLAETDNVRETLYSEILNLISSFESGLAFEIEKKSRSHDRLLELSDVENILATMAKHPLYEPLIRDARNKMASRDLGFRDALHHKLVEYISSIPEADFDKFLGDNSRSLEEQLSSPEIKAMFKRLKDR